MRAKLWQVLEDLNDSFWLRPALTVIGSVVLAALLIHSDRQGHFADAFFASWLYNGGESGARTLLGAIASSTIAVAGTVFSITIATLTLATNQMGPRLLRNFTRDRGNQITLGIYLGTFSYALLVLRSVRGPDEGLFVPHLAITGAVVLALVCVGMLIYFVHHVATRINIDTVIELVHADLHRTLMQMSTTERQPSPPSPEHWSRGAQICEDRSGFIQQLDEDAVVKWADEHDVAIRLYARVGDFVFPGTPVARVAPPKSEARATLTSAIALGAYPTASMDIEFAVTQLVDIALRALSPGINDPNTAIRVIDRFGAALCNLKSRYLCSGVIERHGRTVFQRDVTTYDGLTDAMFHSIRQCANRSPAVLIRLLEVLTKVAECETCPDRLRTLERHGDLVKADGLRTIENAADRETFASRSRELSRTLDGRFAENQRPGPKLDRR